MNSPYEVLGVTPDDDEGMIRRRYLALVRESPPDRAPERFAAIRAAYDDLRDPTKRLEALLFRPPQNDHLDAIIAAVRVKLAAAPLTRDDLLSLADIP